MELDAEFKRIYTQEVQIEFDRLQENQEKARELANMVGSVVVDENLPPEVLEIMADLIKEECQQIRQAAVEIVEEERTVYGIDTGTTLL